MQALIVKLSKSLVTDIKFSWQAHINKKWCTILIPLSKIKSDPEHLSLSNITGALLPWLFQGYGALETPPFTSLVYLVMPIAYSTQFPWIRWFFCEYVESKNLYQSQNFSPSLPVLLNKPHMQILLLRAYPWTTPIPYMLSIAMLLRFYSTLTSNSLRLLWRNYPLFSHWH